MASWEKNGLDRVEDLLRETRRWQSGDRFYRPVDLEKEIAADLDAPIRWRPIAEYDQADDEPRLFYAKGSIYIGACNDGRFEDWVGESREPTHFAELKGPDHG